MEKAMELAVPDVEVADLAEEVALQETAVLRSGIGSPGRLLGPAARSLAGARQTVRLLWIALILSLLAHAIVPACLISALRQPEKVALLDGSESLVIASLVPMEESREILENISFWAAKSLLDRGPQGFDAPDTLQRVFLPSALEKAKAGLKDSADEFAKKSIHQKLEIARIDLQRLDGGVILGRVVGQILTQAQVAGEQIVEPQPITLDLKLVRNPALGRNKRYPFAVTSYSFGPPEHLTLQKPEGK